MHTVFFTRSSFGASFFDTEELKEVVSFFQKAAHGFKIVAPTEIIGSLFSSFSRSMKIERFIVFMKLLHHLNAASYKPLAAYTSKKKYSELDGTRMGAVHCRGRRRRP